MMEFGGLWRNFWIWINRVDVEFRKAVVSTIKWQVLTNHFSVCLSLRDILREATMVSTAN